MIKFEVSGATPEEFAENAMKAWGLLAIGLQQALTMNATALSMPASADVTLAKPSTTHGSESSLSASKVHSDPVNDLFTEEAKPATSKNSKSAKGPKLDDLKARLSEVITAAANRWDVTRANAYARKLLKEFGVEKLGDLPPAAFNSFMDLAGEYIAGSAPE